MTDFRLLIKGRLVKGAGTLDVINPGDRAAPDGWRPGRIGPSWIRRWPPRRRRSPPGRRHRSGRRAGAAGQAGRGARSGAGRIRPPPDPGTGQAAAAGVRGDRPVGRHAPLLRHARPAARGAQGGTPTHKVVRQHKPLGRRRGHHAVELPGDPPDDQSRAGPARRKHGRGQACTDHAADDTQVRRTLCPDPACRRRQRHRRSERPRSCPSPATPTWPRLLSPARPRPARKVMASAAGRLKRLTLELGGKRCAIVLGRHRPEGRWPRRSLPVPRSIPARCARYQAALRPRFDV